MTTEEFNRIKKHTLWVMKRFRLKHCYFDDFFGEACLTFVIEKNKWKSKEGASFMTFVRKVITFRLLDFNRTFYFRRRNVENLKKGLGFRQVYGVNVKSIQDTRQDYSKVIDAKTVVNQIRQSQELNNSEKNIFLLHLIGFRQNEIAEKTRMSPSRICQLIKQAKSKFIFKE